MSNHIGIEEDSPTAYCEMGWVDVNSDQLAQYIDASCSECIRLYEAEHGPLVLDEPDNVNSPGHYTWLPVEAIEITERFNFNMGNALKYIIRADHKGRPVEDLRKAQFYIARELKRRGYEAD